MSEPAVGFAADEINTAEPTRNARLKWVIVVDAALPPGRAVNAAACVVAATATGVTGLLGPDAKDGDGTRHPGLPWAGCAILGATAEQLRGLRARAAACEDVFLADMPQAAQTTRVYDEYLSQLATLTADRPAGPPAQEEGLSYYAISLVGPRKRVDKLVGGLSLLR
jgi:hypothetical protein